MLPMQFVTSRSLSNMTPTEALNTLDQAASLANVSRRDHIAIVQAVETLKAHLAKADVEPKPIDG